MRWQDASYAPRDEFVKPKLDLESHLEQAYEARSKPLAARRVRAAGFSAARAPQEKRGRTFVDAIEQPVVGDPQLSPDGKQILFTIDKADWKANRRVGHIYRINTDGTSQVQLTFGERGEISPRWSPDGKPIAFTTRRDADANNQIYLLSVEGGEARRLTSHPTAPGNVTGRRTASRSISSPPMRSRPKRRRAIACSDDVYAFEENNFKQRHLWTTDLEGKTKRITEGDWRSPATS